MAKPEKLGNVIVIPCSSEFPEGALLFVAGALRASADPALADSARLLDLEGLVEEALDKIAFEIVDEGDAYEGERFMAAARAVLGLVAGGAKCP